MAPDGAGINPAALERETAPSAGFANRWVHDAASSPAFNLRDLEERFAGRALAWIGGFALVAAAIFFLSLAFSRGWITEPMRVVAGLVGGSVALGVGALAFDRKNPLIGNVLTAVGLGVVSIALFAATRGYGLVPPEVGLLGALIAAIAAAVIAIRFDAREVAAFGLVAALIAPPVMGASPNTLTLLFVAVTLVGTTVIALFRTWPYLPPIAFVLAAPQLASWLLGDPDTAQALVALVGFWLVNIVAAAGEEVRIRRDDLRPTSATLVLANAAFLVWGGNVILGAGDHPWLGAFVAAASLAHLAVGGWFLARQGLGHLFGNLVAGTGAALLALAAFIQLGAELVPVAWSAEAAALAWLAVRRAHVWSALGALVLGGLAILHVLVVEYPLSAAGSAPYAALPLLHPEAASMAAVLLAAAVAGVLVPVGWIRSVLAAVGVSLAAYAASFEAVGPALASALAGIALAAVALDRLVQSRDAPSAFPSLDRLARPWFATFVGAAIGVLSLAVFVADALPLREAAVSASPLVGTPVPWAGLGSLAVVLAALTGAAYLLPARSVRSVLVGIGMLLAGYASSFVAGGPLLIAILVGIALAGAELERLVHRLGASPALAAVDAALPTGCSAIVAGGALRVAAIAVLVLVEYPLSGVLQPAAPYTGLPALSLAILVLGLLAAGWQLGTRGIRSITAALSVLLVTWTIPFELEGTVRIAAGAVLLPIAVMSDNALRRWTPGRRFEFAPLPRGAGALVSCTGAVPWTLAFSTGLLSQFPPTQWGSLTPPAIPFSDDAALSALVLAASAVAAATRFGGTLGRQALLLTALVPIALVLPLEVYADFVVVGWLLVAAAALAITHRGDLLRPVSIGIAAVLGAGAVAVAFAIVASPDRLWVVDPAARARPPLLGGWWAALAAVAAVPLVAARRSSLVHWRSALEVAAAAIGVYLVSVGVVDVFQRLVGGSIAVEELAKQAQVALSVTWTAIGAVALGVGLRNHRPMLRHIGFGLLGLATVKVFLVDLAAMDVAYRAVVLAGLGVLLLLSAWLFTHLHGPHAGSSGLHGPRPVG